MKKRSLFKICKQAIEACKTIIGRYSRSPLYDRPDGINALMYLGQFVPLCVDARL